MKPGGGLGARSAHYGISIAQRLPDPMAAWPDAALFEMLRGFAHWSVKHKQTVEVLFSMCCAQQKDAPEASVLPYLLYASTRPFIYEGREAHANPLNTMARLEDLAKKRRGGLMNGTARPL